MKFSLKKMKEISRPMTEYERQEIEERDANRQWLALSAKFALAVRHILRNNNMTQTQLASLMRVSPVQVTKILSGKENISLQTIAKVEQALNQRIVFWGEDTTSTNYFYQSGSVLSGSLSIPIQYSYDS